MAAVRGIISRYCIISAQGQAVSGLRQLPQSTPLYWMLSHMRATRQLKEAGSWVWKLETSAPWMMVSMVVS